MSAYEDGHTFPKLDTLERIARAADAELALVPRGSERVARQFELVREAVEAGDWSRSLRLVAELVAWVRTDMVGAHCLNVIPASSEIVVGTL